MKHYLLKTALAFMAMVCGGISSYAATTASVVIQNASFDADEPIAQKVCTYAKDVQEGEVANMQPVTGWTIAENGDARAAGVFAYGSTAILGGDGGNVPAVGPNGETEGKALGLEAVWTATTQYTQDVTLPAGEYLFEAVVYNAAGTGALSANLIGIDGTYCTTKNYPVGKWTKDQVKITLDEEKTVTISLGINSGNIGNANAPHLFIDHVSLYGSDEIAAIELAAAKENALATIEALAIGEEMFCYSETAIEAAKTAVNAAETIEAVEAAVAAALAAQNKPAADKTYSFQLRLDGETPLYMALAEGGITIAEEATALKFTEAETAGQFYMSDEEGTLIVGLAGNNAWTMSTAADKKVAWSFTPLPDGAYRINNLVSAGCFVGTNSNDKEAGKPCYADKKADNGNVDWLIAEYVAPEPVKTDYTDYIVNADLKGEGGFDATGTKGIDGSGIVKAGNNATFDFKQTIANLPAGKYKVTAQAAYRYGGNEADEAAAIADGITTKLASLYATVGTKTVNTPVQNRYDGASETDLAGSGAVQVNNLWVPNSSSAVQAWFNAGKYVNEAVFNLAEDGAVTIGIVKTAQPEAGDYTVLGPWTLTRLGDADVEPEPQPEPTPEPGTDMTDKIVNPSFETGDLTGWTVGSSADTGVKPNSDDIYKTEGCDGDYLFNTWWQGIPITQTVTNLANGKYELKALMTNDAITAGNKPCLYLLANGAHSEVFSSPNSGTFAEGSMQFYVTNGTATIGAIGGNADGSFNEAGYYWYKVDNFRLTFVEALPTIDEVEIPEGKMSNDALAAINAAKEAGDVVALLEAVQKAKESIAAYAKAQAAIDAAKAEMSATNVYTAEAFNAYKAIYDAAETKYNDGTLTDADAKALENPEERTAWQHEASILIDDLLLSAWNIGETKAKDYETALYINTWSSEGEGDGTNFLVPFFEYWTGDDDSLGENTLTATISNLQKGVYDVTAWVRVRIKNGAEAPAYGITLQANDGEAANVSDGEQVGAGQFYLKDAAAQGEVGEDGVLNIKFTVAADNNISWLSFKNVKYAFNETATGIQTVNTVNTSNTIYTLSGQKVEKAVKGLYIIGGKKVVVK